MGLIVTFVLGIFILIGALVIKMTKKSKIIEQLSISIALGTMSALVISEIIPETLEKFNDYSNLYTLFFIIIFTTIGILILKILDRFIPEHDYKHGISHNCTNQNLIHIGIVSCIAIILHNIIEGMAVYSMIQESEKVGLLVALGVGLHNIPMGMILYSTLDKKNNKKIFVVALSTFVGGVLMSLISDLLNEFVLGVLLCITLGMLIYIICFELIPHLMHSKNKPIDLIGIVVGILVILISSMFEW